MLCKIATHVRGADVIDRGAGGEAAGRKKVVIAQMSHETNTFSPVPTDLARFGGGLPGSGALPPAGQNVIDSNRGQQTGLGAFIELADAIGAEVVCSISASAPPSGLHSPMAFV